MLAVVCYTFRMADMNKLAYDLVATDVDGTLLDSREELLPQVEEAVREARRRGVRVSLVSGRAKPALRGVLRALDMDQPFIASGGAYIEDPVSGDVIQRESVPWMDAEAMVHMARAADASVFFEYPEWAHAELKSRHSGLLYGVELSALRAVDDVLRDNAGAPMKVSLIGEAELMTEMAEQVRQYNPSLHVVFAFPTCVNISRAGVNKGTAVARLASHFQIPLARVVTIGNQDNDVCMFEVAGLSVAVGNAAPEVQAAAHVVAPSNDEAGVAWVLRELVLR